MGAKQVEHLDVWRLCEEIRLVVNAGIDAAPVPKDFKFCDQILSAAEGAVANVAEGFARFRPREFAQFLGYAIASISEVLERTRFVHSRRYFDDPTAAHLVILCTRADRALRSFRRYLWSVSPRDVAYHADSAPPGRPKPKR